MISINKFNDLVELGYEYFLKNNDGTIKRINLQDYKQANIETFLLRHIECFLPDFYDIYDDYDDFCKKYKLPNQLEQALNGSGLADEGMIEHYKNVKIGLTVGLNNHIRVGKSGPIILNEGRKEPKKFIRTIKVYKEMLEDYIRRNGNNGSNSLKCELYKEYLKMITIGYIPLRITYDGVLYDTNIVDFSSKIKGNCYRKIDDFSSNECYTKIYKKSIIRYFDGEGNNHKVYINNPEKAAEIMAYLANILYASMEELEKQGKVKKKS